VKHVIRPAAKDDIIRQFRYYLLQDAPEPAARFLDAVNESIDHICRLPETGAPKHLENPILAGLRAWPVTGFPDVRIYYLVEINLVRVIRVLHGSRDTKKILAREL
jgi:toxin ParE1/3/4